MIVSPGSSGSEGVVEGAPAMDTTPPRAGVTPHSAAEGARAGAGIVLREVKKLVAEQPQWIVIGILYFFVWYTPISIGGIKGDGPLAWCWPFWYDINFPLGFQLFVPIAVGLLVWSKRALLNTQWKRVVANFPEHHPKREGNLIPLVIGVVLIIFSHFIEVKGVGVFAAILIAFGIVFRLYGTVITRLLIVPFVVFLSMIPPPDSFIAQTCVGKAMNVELKVATPILNLLHFHTLNAGTWLVVNGIPVSASDHIYSGLSVALAVAFICTIYGLYFRIAPTSTLWMALLGLFLAFAGNVVRVLAIAITFTPALEISKVLVSSLVSWIDIALVFAATWYIMRARIKPLAVKINTPLSVHHAVRLAGSGIETMALPLVGAGKVMRLVGKGWTWSERRLERLLKALTPKRKRRRGGGGSNRRYK